MLRRGMCSVVCCTLATGVCSVGWGQAAPQVPPGGQGKPAGMASPARWKLTGFLRDIPEMRLAFNLVPRIGAAFGFTEDQVNQFGQAYDAANLDGDRQAARQKMQDPNLSKQDRRKIQADLEAKVKDLRAKLEALMTPEQKALMQKIADASKAAEKALKDSLDQSLTPEEKQRMEQAGRGGPGAEKPAKPAGQ